MKVEKTFSTYLNRYATDEYQIEGDIHQDTDAIVVLPSFYEENLLKSLQSLSNNITDFKVCIFVVINEPENVDNKIAQFHVNQFQEITSWIKNNKNQNLKFFAGNICRIKNKIAGVGMARKAGMDEAFRKLQNIDSLAAPIICFDADATCQDNFLESVISYFKENPKSPGASIAFEHPLSDNDLINKGIILYESHLHYYIAALRYAQYPYAYHTVGSSMACRANTYATIGGMNKRKAGEDFYFLHRIIPMGNFGQIHNTRIFPEARISDRVPFGTGRAMIEFTNGKEIETYCPEIFYILRPLFEILNSGNAISEFHLTHLREILHPDLMEYLNENDLIEKIKTASSAATNNHSRFKKYYEVFDGLTVLKIVHHLTDHLYQKVPVESASKFIFQKQYRLQNIPQKPLEILETWRTQFYKEKYTMPFDS
ncbi:hypothetical protein [Mangrovivirga cuniculi]|uniref:Glycosyltransferase 2-like domain-containing protein n=1 Tax=Mangrovivirga cuniculi TaxID=2715131 RepID=A0A4D7JIJ8_9BACT|nr:hypothetical protein [Mangrovivirga cuniculi]QCK15819.1 hypothetical protein DCC35_14230 [Mangrovivirga cuniculi]